MKTTKKGHLDMIKAIAIVRANKYADMYTKARKRNDNELSAQCSTLQIVYSEIINLINDEDKAIKCYAHEVLK